MSWEGRGVDVDWEHVGGGTLRIEEDDIPAWDRPAAPPANTPMEKFHRLRPQQSDAALEVQELTPETHRAAAIAAMDAQAEAAALALSSFLSWARSIGYHAEVIEPLETAAELVAKGQGLVDAFEVRS